jgi:hypothetical protein
VSEQPQGEGWWQAADGKWYPPQPPQPTMNALALTSLVCGLVGLAMFRLGAVVSILAVVFGHVALRQIRQAPTPQRGRGMAVAGLALGYVTIVLAIIFWAWFLWWAE